MIHEDRVGPSRQWSSPDVAEFGEHDGGRMVDSSRLKRTRSTEPDDPPPFRRSI